MSKPQEEPKTPEQIRAENVSTAKTLAQEIFTCATDFRNAIEQLDTNLVKGVDVKAAIPTLTDAEIATAQIQQVQMCAGHLDAKIAACKAKLQELSVLQ